MSIPKILILTPGLGRGGAQKIFKDQVRFYSKQFDATACIFNRDGTLEEEKDFVVLSLDVPAGNHWISKLYFFCKRIARVRAIKRRFKFDVSISHLEGADYVNILSRQNEKVICYIHGTKFHDGAISGFLGWIRKKILMPWLYHKADLIVPVSRGIQDEFLMEFEVDPDKIKIVLNGFDVRKIESQRSEMIPSQYNIVFEKHKTICLCSRLAPQKNQEIFLSIFSYSLKAMNCKLIILGDGELRSDLIEKSKQLNLRVFHVWDNMLFSDNFDVYFFGNLTNPFPYVARTSVFALPSSWEGFPLALCEAMACGVPVVASDCPTGPREILVEERNKSEYGFLLPIPLDSDKTTLQKWTETLNHVLSNESLAEDYAEKAKLRVKDFSVEKMEAAWLEIVKPC